MKRPQRIFQFGCWMLMSMSACRIAVAEDAAPAAEPTQTPAAVEPAQAAPPAAPTGLSMYPGVFLVQGIPPGMELDLAELAPSTAIIVYNRSGQQFKFSIVAKSPQDAQAIRWERGYEPIPDSSWIRMNTDVLDIPPKSEGKAGIVLNLPEGDEWCNRKFIGSFILSPKTDAIEGLAMSIAGRILFETEVKPGIMSGAPIGLQPPVIEMAALRPGSKGVASVTVRNNTTASVKYRTGRITDVVKREDTYDRFVTNGCTALVTNSWANTASEFSLKAAEEIKLEVNIAIPADAEVGKAYEELIFIESLNGIPTGNDREPGGPTTFIRVRMTPATGQ